MPFWRGRTFADAVVRSWRSVSGGVARSASMRSRTG